MQPDFCFARDVDGEYYGAHLPVPGVYDGMPITTCAHCGVTLWAGDSIKAEGS